MASLIVSLVVIFQIKGDVKEIRGEMTGLRLEIKGDNERLRLEIKSDINLVTGKLTDIIERR